jgi:hypothetical protein
LPYPWPRFFLADPDGDIGGAVHAIDVLHVQVADDSGFGAPADREHDPRRILSGAVALAYNVGEVDWPERAIESGGGAVIRPAVHRRVVVGDERPDGDLGADQHRGITP